jgi:ribosome-associated protein
MATTKKTKAALSKELARTVAQAAYDIKGEDITVMDLSKLSDFTDFFIIVTGRSDRQVQAICSNIEDVLAKKKIRPISIEGYQKGHWVLIDYGSVVAHIFYEEVRSFYALEKLWSDAPRVKFRLT